MTLRDLVVDYLDPSFVREEELAARFSRLDSAKGNGKWVRRFKLSQGYASRIPGNTDIDFGIPETNKQWIISGIFVEYNTDATVANRQIVIYYDPRTDYGQIPHYVLPGPMIASLSYDYFIAPNLQAYNFGVAGAQLGFYAPLPLNVLVDEGLRLTVALGKAGDEWRAVMYYWEWSE